MTDAAIHRVSHNAYDLSLRLLAHSGSPRASALAMTRVVRNEVCGSITACSLSLRGENEVSDAAIHRVSGNAYDLSLRLLAHSGSPRANALAMTRLEWTGSEYNFVIARKERSERRGNPSYLEGDERLVSSLTGSQWIATGIRPRDDKSGGKRCRANFKKTRLFFLLGNKRVYRRP